MPIRPDHRPTTRLNIEKLEDRVTPAVDFVPNHVLFAPLPGAEAAAVAGVNGTGLVKSIRPLSFGVYLAVLNDGVTVPNALPTIGTVPWLKFAEPDYKMEKYLEPNDPSFVDGTLWAHKNTGQNGGTAGADSRSVFGWDDSTGTGQTIVAVIDDGIQHTHPDLTANMWTNPGEVPGNGVDDDANGFIDDIHGWDFTRDTGDILGGINDDHGTHVSGTIGAVGNNGIGVTGSTWKTRMMTLPLFSNGANSGAQSVAIEAIGYAVRMGSRVSNNSWGNRGTAGQNVALGQAIAGARDAGHIFVAAAGNDAVDNDVNDNYPSNFYGVIDNMVAVAAYDRNDQLANFSQWGLRTVTLGAPGVAIFSTFRNAAYDFLDGTSMATPQVTGAISNFWDANPDFTYDEVIAALKRSVRQIPTATSKVDTGGVLDLEAFMAEGGGAVYATGAGEGGGPHVKVYRRTREVGNFFAYDFNFTGGVRVTTGDVNGDRSTDIITAAGPGGGPHVKVFDGKTFQEIFSFYAFEESFRGGVTLASADVNGDGRMDIVVGADKGGGPRVSVFSLPAGFGEFVRTADFFAYDATFTGGVRVAAGLFNPGSPIADVLTAPGRGGGPHVRQFSSTALLGGNVVVANETMAGDPFNADGLFIAAGDTNGDGVADVTVGAGAGSSVVRLLDGRTFGQLAAFFNPYSGEPFGLTNPAGALQIGSPTVPILNNNLLPPGVSPNALAFEGNQVKPVQQSGHLYGVRVAMQDVNGDKRADLILAGGPNDAPTIALIDGTRLVEIRHFSAYDPAFFGGVFVGGVSLL